MSFIDNPTRRQKENRNHSHKHAKNQGNVVSLNPSQRHIDSNVTSLYESSRQRQASLNEMTSVYNPLNSYYQSISERIQYRVNQFIVTFILALVGIITAIFGVLVSGDLISF